MEGKKNNKKDFEVVEKQDCTPGQEGNTPKENEKENNKNINLEIKDNIIDKEKEKLILSKNFNTYIKYIKKNMFCEIDDKTTETEEKEESKNILVEFLEDKNILKNKKKLIAFMEELKVILKSGNNCILPFLDLCPILIKEYIESDLDEEDGNNELKYLEIFELLKYNTFISREYLYPIYDYFGHLYYLMNILEVSNKRLNKFKKVLELWNIIYTFEPENFPQIELYNKNDKKMDKISLKNNTSSFCFLGTGLEFEFNEEIFHEYYIRIEIFSDMNLLNELNEDVIVLNIKEKNNPIKVSMKEIKDKLPQDETVHYIDIQISEEIKIIALYNDMKNISITIPIKYTEFQFNKFSILENYYGQIKKIQFLKVQLTEGNDKKKNKNDKGEIATDYTIIPDLLSDNFPYYDENLIGKLKFINPNLAKVNYINYLNNDFNLIEYFLGIKPLIPFVFLIKGIHQNTNIENINGKDKFTFLKETFLMITLVLISILVQNKRKGKKTSIKNGKSSKNNEQKNEQNSEIKDKETLEILKYDLFAFYIALQLPIELIFGRQEIDKEKIQALIEKIAQLSSELFEGTDDCTLLYSFINYPNDEDFYSYLEGEKKILTKIQSDIQYLNHPLLFECSYQQLFRSLMKELFIYNRLWSIKEVFFSKDNIDYYDESFNKIKIKYKQLSYYTKSLEQPYLYPILEIKEYIPKFSKFNEKDLFKHDLKETLNYDFNLKKNQLFQTINNCVEKEKDPNLKSEECCLVKKGYHVKGRIFINNLNNNTKNKESIIIFQSIEIPDDKTCNKKIKDVKKNKQNNNDNLCYGAVYPCLLKDMDRKIIIKLEDIDLALVRNYFKSTSAIELFVSKKNKSYYFNFCDILSEKNLIIKLLSETSYFQKIKLNSKKYLDRYYNKNQDNILFYFLSEKFPQTLIKKLGLINRYDLLILNNILANRSFKDLYQYPIFPILYKPSKILEGEPKNERDLSKHLGLQEISAKSIKRKQLIIGLDDESDDCEYKGKSKENFIFNIHYSNPTFVGNYLIRVFPYSLAAIELQGDGFDSPNRQFYCMEKSLENTLSQKSDLREFIPELYYFSDLFFNKNLLKLGTLSTGEEIDDLYIKEKNEDKLKKYSYLKELKNYFLNDEELNINSWIDLIFGFQQEKNSELKRDYYSKDKYIRLNKKDQIKEINKPLNLELVEFGVQPLKILDSKFPDLNNNKDNDEKKLILNRLMTYKLDEFYSTHLTIKNNKDMCFLFEWDEYLHHQRYINFLTFEETDSPELKLTNYYKYSFKGNILGDIIITKSKIDPKNPFYSESVYEKTDFSSTFREDIFKNKQDTKVYEPQNEKYQTNNNETVLMKLSDHYKQIKYIDYNPRLNLFLSYGLDGYINIYIFPNCKLIRTIKVKDITKSDNVLLKLALISNPFPMLFFHDINYIYILSINGDLINKKEIQKNKTIIPQIDKILGLSNDSINEYDYQEEKNFIDMKKFDLPTFEEIN